MRHVRMSEPSPNSLPKRAPITSSPTTCALRTASAARNSSRDTEGVSGYGASRNGRNMKTFQANVPDYLARLARLAAEAAAKEQTTLDSIVAAAQARFNHLDYMEPVAQWKSAAFAMRRTPVR